MTAPIDIAIDDRVEVYTPNTGTYWGYVTDINGTEVTLDEIGPAGMDVPLVVDASVIVKVMFHGRRPEGHVGRWEGYRR